MNSGLKNLTLVILIFAIASCNYRANKVDGIDGPQQGQGNGGTGNPPPPSELKPWFSVLQKEVLKPRCVECHRPGNMKADVNLTTYAAIMDEELDPPLIEKGKPKSSRLYRSLITPNAAKRMPEGTAPLSENEIKAFYDWIVQGAPKHDLGADSLEAESGDEEDLGE